MEFDYIIHKNFSIKEQNYYMGYFNAITEDAMYQDELVRKGGDDDASIGLKYAIKVFQKEFLDIMCKTLSLEEIKHYTICFSVNDQSILDNVRL